MTRLLTTHDGNELARALRDLANDLEKGTRPKGAILRANDWHGHLRGANTDPGRSGDPGDPTGESATGRAVWTNTIASEIAMEAFALGRRVVILRSKIGMIPAPVDSVKAADELADENSGAGWCDCCGERASGSRDNRLTMMRIVETIWHNGETTERVYDRRVDQACRKAWGRHTAANGSVGFLDWEQQRKHGRERETA